MENNGFITDEEKLALRVMESFRNPDNKSTAALEDDDCMEACRDLADIEAALRSETYPVDTVAELRRFHRKHSRHRRKTLLRLASSIAVAAAFAGALAIILPGIGDGTIATGSNNHTTSFQKQVPPTSATDGEKTKGTCLQKTIATPRSKTKTLPDGTKVWLYAGSKLTYPSRFTTDCRTVELSGEAFFSVAHDAGRPFIVKSGSLMTKVLGTKFYVKNYKGDMPKVTLIEGKVEVIDVGNRNALTLKPGQSVTVDADGHFDVATETDAYAKMDWKNGYLYFDNATLDDIINAIAEWYGLDVEWNNGDTRFLRVHITIPNDVTADKAIEMINRLGMAHVSVSNDKIIVK